MSAAVVLIAFAATAAAEFQVPLTVTESAGVARKAEPVSGGVPLPRGMFRRDQAFALFAADGKEVPCQVSPLVVETDGTLRWVLLDFQADVPAGATNAYTLRAARPSARPARPLQVADAADGITVDTGAMKFTVARGKPFGLFDSVLAGGKPVVTGGAATYVQMQGRKAWNDPAEWTPRQFVAGPPETLRAWYAGPMRVTVEAAGHFTDDPLKAGYRCWITAWAGAARALVKYSLTNSNPDQYTAILVGRSALELCLEPGPPGPAVAAVTGKQTPGWVATPNGTVFACDTLLSTSYARLITAGHSSLSLRGIVEPFGSATDARGRPAAGAQSPNGFWLFDCSHYTSEYLLDFSATGDSAAMDALAKSARNRLWALAPAEHYGQTESLAAGRFGSLTDERACYDQWGWTYQAKQVPSAARPEPGAFVAWEDNHYESEADSVQGLLLMYLRTGQRGWFDQAEAWARYHMDLQAWRTDGWRWKDGAIWFPQGGPLGNRPVRAKWNFAWGPDWGERKGNRDCADLWRTGIAKGCYCHFYGSGLADWFCLTGDRDALDAAIDNVETKNDEFRRSKAYVPGRTPVGEIRGFGRGFEVLMRVLMADPGNQYMADLAHLAARTLWQSPLLDERGFHAAAGGIPSKELSPSVLKYMEAQGITFTRAGDHVEALRKGDRTWPVRAFGGTWQHVYIQNGAELYAHHFGDEDMQDFTVAFAEMSARCMLSPKCHQTWYYTYFDVPDIGMVFDPWAFDHTATTDGLGCVHSGWYTRFYPDACAKGYSLTGERRLLERARDFWAYGSKREYQTKQPSAGPNQVGIFASHKPPKDDQVLSVSRLLYEFSHPRKDNRPPAAVTDLAVRLFGDGRAEVRFTAPADAGGGRIVRYQVKVSTLPIIPYEDWEYARDLGAKRNWWRADNCAGEPAPSPPGTVEKFVVTGVPAGQTLHFAVRSFDDSGNRSAISNLARP